MIRVKRGGRVIYSTSRTFEKLAVAKRWARQIETQLDDPQVLEQRTQGSGATVGALIRRYIKEVDEIKPLGRTQKATLEMLLDWPIAGRPAMKLTSSDCVEHAKARRAKGTGPSTVLQDFAFLRSVLGMAKPAWNIPVTTAAIDEARPLMDKLQLVSRPGRRDRRPTPDELKRLLEYFREQDTRSVIPMAEIVDFALWTARRLGEIVQLRWVDVDEVRKTCILRDMKDPRRKAGNDFEFPLLGKALDIIKRQPKIDELIFPYSSKSVGARYTRAKAELKINDLRFHDLRREAASRLFEAGYQVHEVAQVTGHRDLNTLFRIYTKLNPAALHKATGHRR